MINNNNEEIQQNLYCVFKFKQEIIHRINFGDKSKKFVKAQGPNIFYIFRHVGKWNCALEVVVKLEMGFSYNKKHFAIVWNRTITKCFSLYEKHISDFATIFSAPCHFWTTDRYNLMQFYGLRISYTCPRYKDIIFIILGFHLFLNWLGNKSMQCKTYASVNFWCFFITIAFLWNICELIVMRPFI